MYYYFPTTFKDLDGIQSYGIAPTTHTFPPLSDNLGAVARENPEAILVIEVTALSNNTPDFIPSSAFVNLNPYMIPRKIVAAGGYVLRDQNNQREVLLIFRRGKWDLPKGKQDANESNEETALREVQEELGIQNVQLAASLGTTFHGYPHYKGKFFDLKTTYWYAMTTSDEYFTPQTEEDIEAVDWFTLEEALSKLGYETLTAHLQQHLSFLSNLAL